MIEVLIVGGTWAPHGHPVTDAFARALDPSRFSTRMVPYPADYGRQTTFADSRAAGTAALVEAVHNTDNRVILAGYSQGAVIAGDLAAEIGQGHRPEMEVLACALIADPLRPTGRFLDPDPGGYGIAGERPIDGVPTYWSAAPGDPITALPPGNPLRTIADLSQYFTLTGPEAVARWGQSLVEVAIQRQMQDWWSPENFQSWGGAIAFARGYLLDGRHTDDYVRFGHAARLGAVLNDEVAVHA
ncbi:PE-PPE domain-containing protein [Nocardia sp. NPDC050712]|uniref:PE-PPE domain-containing protein n=1 Tax=Nocardia sp. NPDC050712 TaxID=3155518 RepID=UPI00340FD42D